MGPTRRHVAVATLLLLVIVLTSSLIAASPLAVGLLDRQSRDWERLSWIGQTYGAASALLAVLALIGVAVSLFMQAREAKASREQTLRAIHTELLQMAMDDEVYRRCWGPFFASDDPTGQREHMYVNLIISNWQMQYELRVFSEPHLRSAAHILFSGEVGNGSGPRYVTCVLARLQLVVSGASMRSWMRSISTHLPHPSSLRSRKVVPRGRNHQEDPLDELVKS